MVYTYIRNIIILCSCCIRHAMPQRSLPWSRDAEIPKLFIRNGIIRLKRHRRIALQQTFFDSWRCGIPPTRIPPPVRLNVSPVGHPPYRVVDTGVVETYPDLTGRPRVISRTDTCAAAAYRFASRDFLHFCFFNFTHGVNSMIFGIRCDISSIALFFSSIPLYLYLP